MKSMLRIIGLVAIACGTLAIAQAPVTGLTLTTSSGAIGLCLHLTSCNVGSLSVESLSVTPNFSIESTQLLSPSDNLSMFGGGIKYTPPIDAWLTKNTLIPAHTIQLALRADPGILNNGSTVAPGTPHFGALSGVEVGYAPASDGRFVVALGAYGAYTPGFGGSAFGVGYTGSIAYLFGGTKAAGASSQARRVWGTKH